MQRHIREKTGWCNFNRGVVRYTMFNCHPYSEIAGHLMGFDSPAVPLPEGTALELSEVMDEIDFYLIDISEGEVKYKKHAYRATLP